MNLTDRLRILRSHGWFCLNENRADRIMGQDRKPYLCVTIEGNLADVPRAAFLCRETGRAMLVGEFRDLTWDEFIRALEAGTDGMPVADSSTKKPVPPQRSLF